MATRPRAVHSGGAFWRCLLAGDASADSAATTPSFTAWHAWRDSYGRCPTRRRPDRPRSARIGGATGQNMRQVTITARIRVRLRPPMASPRPQPALAVPRCMPCQVGPGRARPGRACEAHARFVRRSTRSAAIPVRPVTARDRQLTRSRGTVLARNGGRPGPPAGRREAAPTMRSDAASGEFDHQFGDH